MRVFSPQARREVTGAQELFLAIALFPVFLAIAPFRMILKPSSNTRVYTWEEVHC
jgi:hypothetical protein